MMEHAPTLVALLRHNHDRHGTKAAVVATDCRITHADLDDASRALAGRLVAAGVGKGARVGVLLPNGVEWALVAAGGGARGSGGSGEKSAHREICPPSNCVSSAITAPSTVRRPGETGSETIASVEL